TSKIPNAQKPKTRPPRGLRDHFLFPGRSLPTYTGPYSVGTMEIEVPAQEPRTFSNIKRHGIHMLQLETVLMTVYYPAAVETQELASRRERQSRELWLGRPRLGIASGYSHFASLGQLGIPVFLPTMFTKLPAYRNAPLAKHWAPVMNLRNSRSGPDIKLEEGETPKGQPEKPVFPMIMFSHGLGGTRTMYSSVCGEFASYGFVVVAVEHRDGSGPCTYINHPNDGPEDMDKLEREGGIDHTAEEKKRGWSRKGYTFPETNKFDTNPRNPKGVDHELRSAQIELRLAELEEAYAVMCVLNNGDGEEIAKRNLRRKGFKSASSQGLSGVDWSTWKERLHLFSVTACGHSFGAATICEMLRHDDRFHYVSQGIIYDIWGAGTRPVEQDHPNHRIKQPLLAINSEAFTYWPSNYQLVSSLIDEAHSEPSPQPAWLLTLRGTVHVSQSDFSLLYPHLCSFLLKMVANPRRALDLNINASLEFLAGVLPPELAEVSRSYNNEGLLVHEANELSQIPSVDMHRPKEKYTAMRLKIKHEWLFRINPGLARKIKRKQSQRSGNISNEDDEVWLHCKPT
ncbi:platelet-activating factor acetylhydrolase-like protein, partial [Polychaeton citri CBS 116435]